MHNLPTPSTTPQDVDDVSARSNSGGPSEAKARLRKACDSCSIRKVKVRLFFMQLETNENAPLSTYADQKCANSAMRKGLLAELVPP